LHCRGGQPFESILEVTPLERHKTDLVNDHRVDAEQPLLELSELAGFEDLPDQIGGDAREEYAPFCLVASTPRSIAKLVLPVPIGPTKMRLAGAVTAPPRASVWICVALDPVGGGFCVRRSSV
jgi:hypothetical protein